jgi:hypothetical protein
MRRPSARGILTRHAVAWSYLGGVILAEATYALLPDRDRAALLQWASTNVHNLQHDPVGCMVVSAFFPDGSARAWPALIALAMFGANRALGNWRTVTVCAAGHVIGTLVSEGILDYRVMHGTLPATSRFIIDVGPSYVVVAAIGAAVLYGGRVARAAALLDFALLAFVGDIFAGLSRLDVAAVGHLTALTAGAAAATLLMARARRQRQATPGQVALSQAALSHAALSQAAPGQAAPGQAAPGVIAPATSARDTGGRRAAERAAHRRPPA